MVLPPPEPNDEEELEELPEDHDTPFSPPDDSQPSDDATGDNQQQGTIDPTHPATDTNIEEEELYDEGLSGAAEAEEPKTADTVVGYHKPGSDKDKGGKHGNHKAT
jgi:hypothetical protein